MELQIARAGVVAMRVIELKRDGGVPVGREAVEVDARDRVHGRLAEPAGPVRIDGAPAPLADVSIHRSLQGKRGIRESLEAASSVVLGDYVGERAHDAVRNGRLDPLRVGPPREACWKTRALRRRTGAHRPGASQ